MHLAEPLCGSLDAGERFRGPVVRPVCGPDCAVLAPACTPTRRRTLPCGSRGELAL